MAAPMKDELDLPLKYDVTFQKKGLEPNEWEECLKSKVSNLNGKRLDHVVTSAEVEKAINELKKNVCFRKNITRPALDKRNSRAINDSSRQGMRKFREESVEPKGCEESKGPVDLKQPVKPLEPKEPFKEPTESEEPKEPEKLQQPKGRNPLTPTQEKKDTDGIRGTKRSDTKPRDDYHDEQHRLFSEEHLLGKKFSNLFPNIVLKEDNKGYFINLSDDEPLSAEDACRVIDKFTNEFIVYLIRLREMQAALNEWEPQNICDIRSKCLSILSGRRVVAWEIPKNLMNLKEYNQWKGHVFEEMSYAALIVVLDLIQKKPSDELDLLPKYDVTFQKKGLEPHEWEECLNSKVSNLNGKRLDHVVTSAEVEKAINELKKDVCFRENITSPGLDKRNSRALESLSRQGMLKYLKESEEPKGSEESKEPVDLKRPVEPNELLKEPEKLQQPKGRNPLTPTQEKKATSGIRGTKRSDRKRRDDYHDEQHRLFSEEHLLGKKFGNLFPNIVLKEDNKGYFINPSDDEPLSAEDACRVIDKFTNEFIVYLIRLREKKAAPNEWEPQNICDIRSKCLSILSGRRVVAWANSNNLMNLREYTEWKRHVFIEMSYAALIVVLDLIHKKP